MLLFLIGVWFKIKKPRCSDSRSRSTALTVQPMQPMQLFGGLNLRFDWLLLWLVVFIPGLSIKSLHAY